MARQTLILAKNIQQANSYAKLAGLQRYTYRAVQSTGQISGTMSAEVHILPDFLTSPSRHGILDALRWKRGFDVYYVDPDDFAEPVADPRGDLTDEVLDLALRFHSIYLTERPETPSADVIEINRVMALSNEDMMAEDRAIDEAEQAAKVEKPKPVRKPRAQKPAAITSDLF